MAACATAGVAQYLNGSGAMMASPVGCVAEKILPLGKQEVGERAHLNSLASFAQTCLVFFPDQFKSSQVLTCSPESTSI
jgi:hypothetical protein